MIKGFTQIRVHAISGEDEECCNVVLANGNTFYLKEKYEKVFRLWKQYEGVPSA
jgi:hypothetical protein